jgi:uncharacterized protein YbjT (DUF2867 family)
MAHSRRREAREMNIVVVGGSGLIGTKVVDGLRDRGHDVMSASLQSGVNTITGDGLALALTNAQVVVDVTNAASFEDAAVMDFFTTSTRNLLAAETEAGVAHHVALSIVGIDRLPASGYYRAKVAQERLIEGSSTQYTIVRSTQFFEFVDRIADEAADGDTVHLAPVLVQPIAADDVAEALCEVAIEPAVNGTVEVAGPQQFRLDDLVRTVLSRRDDPRKVISDPDTLFFGTQLDERSLIPEGSHARPGKTDFAEWQRHRDG